MTEQEKKILEQEGKLPLEDEKLDEVSGGTGESEKVQLPLDCALLVCKCSTEGNVTVYANGSVYENGTMVYGGCCCKVCNAFAAMVTKEPNGKIGMIRYG